MACLTSSPLRVSDSPGNAASCRPPSLGRRPAETPAGPLRRLVHHAMTRLPAGGPRSRLRRMKWAARFLALCLLLVGCTDPDTVDTADTADDTSGDVACPANLLDCDGVCVDTDNDPAHCGGCDNVCGDGEVCSASTCETITCGVNTFVQAGQCVACAPGTYNTCLLYTSPSPRDKRQSRMPSSA